MFRLLFRALKGIGEIIHRAPGWKCSDCGKAMAPGHRCINVHVLPAKPQSRRYPVAKTPFRMVFHPTGAVRRTVFIGTTLSAERSGGAKGCRPTEPDRLGGQLLKTL